MEHSENWRDRKFRLLLYPEDPTHENAMRIIKECGMKYAAILHDRDKWEEGDDDRGDHEPGTLKKPHWHVVLKFPQARWRNPVAEQLKIKPNYVKPCDNMDGALRYLIHEGFPDKEQYDLSEVEGPLVPALAKLLLEETIEARVLNIVDMIDAHEGYLSYRTILVEVCNAGLFGEFHRLGPGIKYLLDEHNGVNPRT